jgi:hypothetical protein
LESSKGAEKQMYKFQNTSEYAYLSVLFDLYQELLDMVGKEQFTEDQLDIILPKLIYAGEILEMNRDDLVKKDIKQLN